MSDDQVTHEAAHAALVEVNSYPECTARSEAVRVVQRYIKQQKAEERLHADQMEAGRTQLEMAARDFASLEEAMGALVSERDQLREKLSEHAENFEVGRKMLTWLEKEVYPEMGEYGAVSIGKGTVRAIGELRERADALSRANAVLRQAHQAAVEDAWRLLPPQEMELYCPACGKQHLDIGEFQTRVHRKHLCENTPSGPNTGCGRLWVPFPYPTKGVLSRRTRTLRIIGCVALIVERVGAPLLAAYCYLFLLHARTLGEALVALYLLLYCGWSIAFSWSTLRDRELT